MDAQMGNSQYMGDFGPKYPMAHPMYIGDYWFNSANGASSRKDYMAVYRTKNNRIFNWCNPIHLEERPIASQFTISNQNFSATDTYFYIGRNICKCGELSDYSLSDICNVPIILDGADYTIRPPVGNNPSNLQVKPIYGGRFLITWDYIRRKDDIYVPDVFWIWIGTSVAGLGLLTAVRFNGTHYEYTTGQYTNGVRYYFKVLSYRYINPTWYAEFNDIIVSAIADSSAPDAIESLTVERMTL